MPGQIDALRNAGFSDDEISTYATEQQHTLAAAGFSGEEINTYLGAVPPPKFNPAPLQQHIRDNLAAANDSSPQQVKSFEDALSAGFQLSVPSLLKRGRAPDKVLAADAPWTSHMAATAAQTVGDIPTMVAGALVGGAGGSETGPGAAITAAGGAFALPTAMRETLMDSYTKGQFKSFGDFWNRAKPIFMDTLKSYVTGGAVAATGGAVAPLAEAAAVKAGNIALPALVSPTVKALVTGGAEAGTMTAVGAALDGHVPKAQDFVDNAVLMGGFHAATGVAGKLRDVYAKTGVPPDAVRADAAQDVTIPQDLLSSNVALPKTYADAMPKDDAKPYFPEGDSRNGPAAVTVAPEAGSLDEAQQNVLSRVSVGQRDGLKLPTLDQVYTNMVDDLHPLKEPSGDLPTAQNPYELARLSRGVAGKADHFINYGTFDFNTYENNGPGLRSILEPVKDDLDAFRAYAVSRRAVELRDRDIKTGIDPQAAAKVIAGGEQYSKPFQDLVDYQNRVAAYARDSGLLSKDGFAAMTEANKNFVPFYRVMDDSAGSGGKGGKPFKAIKGSDRVIIDPIESAVKNTYAITAMAERNAVNKAFADLGPELSEKVNPPTSGTTVQDSEMAKFLKAHGIEDMPDDLLTVFRAGRAPLEADQIRVFEDGKPATYRVDPDIAKALGSGLQPADVNWIQRLLSLPANLVRAGAVLTPEFGLRHVIRDGIYAFTTSDPGKTISPWDMAKGLSGLLVKDPDYQNWLKSGGSNISMVALDRRYMQESLQDLSAKTGLMNRAWNVISSPLEAMRAFTELAENASHLGAFKQYVSDNADKAGIQDAGFASRAVSVDTARIGAKMRAYNQLIAFANVTLQDSDRVVRAFADKPVATAVKIGLSVSLPSALLWWANKDDERVKELPDWEKDLFWIIPTDKWETIDPRDAVGVPEYLLRGQGANLEMNNGHIFRISKPFGAGVVFGTGVERMLDAFAAHNPDAFKGFAASIADTVTPGVVPSAAVPVVEQFANRSTFTGGPIVPSYAEKFLPEYQYTPYTTEAAKKIGQVIGSFPGMDKEAAGTSNSIIGGTARALTSPALIENYVQAWGGGLGKYALEIGDAIGRKTGVLDDPVRATADLADVPVVKAFIARYPTAGVKSVQDFHESYQLQKTVYDTWLSRANAGDIKGMDRVQSVDPTAFGKLDAIDQVLGEHAKLIRDMNDLQPDENADRAQVASDKRQTIDRLYYNMIEMAREGNRINAEVAKSLGDTKH